MGYDKLLRAFTEVDVSSQLRKYQINNISIKSMAKQVLASQTGESWMMSVKFVSKEKIKRLNRDYRNTDKPTDVLAFPQELPAGLFEIRVKPIGDVVICPDVARSNADRIGHSLDREVSFLLVHGILHLCGYDHQTKADEALMLAQQRRLVGIFDRKRSWVNCIRSSVDGGS